MGSGLPHAQGVHLELNSSLHVLAVATHGRGAWYLSTGVPPAFTSASSTTFTVGTFGTFTVTTTGTPTPSIMESGTLPSGVMFVDNGDGTGTLSGTPGPGTGGVYPITFTASNGVGSPAMQSFTLTVDQPPAITSASSTTFTVGTLGSFTVTTTGYPTPGIMEWGALPTGVTFVDNGNGTGTLSGKPAAGTGGVYHITFTASNGVGSPAVQPFTLTVDQAPAVTSLNYTTFIEGTPGSFTITTTGFPTPAITYIPITGLPSGVSLVDNGNGTATLGGTATVNGVFAFWVIAKNGVSPSAQQSFSLTVLAPVTATPTSLAFGKVHKGTSAKRLVTVKNNSPKTVGIGPVTFTVTMGSKTQFSLGPVCPATLGAGASCTIGVIFTPNAVGNDAATLNIAYGAAGSPAKVSITAAGIK